MHRAVTIAAACLVGTALAAPPPGWTELERGGASTTFTRDVDGDAAHLYLQDWSEGEDASDVRALLPAFRDGASHLGEIGGRIESARVTRTGPSGESITLRSTSGGYVSAFVSCGPDDRIRTLEILAPPAAIGSGALVAETVVAACDPETVETTETPEVTASAGRTAPEAETSAPPATLALDPIELESLWYTARHVASSTGLVPQLRTVMLFDDGSATTDGEAVMSEGREASRAERPDRWLRGRVAGDELVLRGDRGEIPYAFTVRTRPIHSSAAVEGCWTSETSFASDVGGGSSIAISGNRICLVPTGETTGRFGRTRRSTVGTISGVEAGSAGSSDASAGTFELDGHVLRLDAADGTREFHPIGTYAGSDGARLVIGHRRFEPD